MNKHMDKNLIKKAQKPEQNKLPQERVQPDKEINTISVPKPDMIMPNEFNSVSDPKIRNQSANQAANSFSLEWEY